MLLGISSSLMTDSGSDANSSSDDHSNHRNSRGTIDKQLPTSTSSQHASSRHLTPSNQRGIERPRRHDMKYPDNAHRPLSREGADGELRLKKKQKHNLRYLSHAGKFDPSRKTRSSYSFEHNAQSSAYRAEHSLDPIIPHREETVNLIRTGTTDPLQESLGSDNVYGFCPISSGQLFFYAILTTNGIILQPSQNQLPPSLKNVIGHGKVRDISVRQLGSAALWLLTGFVELGDSPMSVTRQKGNAADSVPLTNSKKRTRTTQFGNSPALLQILTETQTTVIIA